MSVLELLPKTVLDKLQTLQFHTVRKRLGVRQGGHISLKRGHGIEFADYRRYVPGDNPRYIDWNVLARLDKLYVKQFQEEQDISVLILLDSSSSMDCGGEEKEKWRTALSIALGVAYVGLANQDRVKIADLGGRYISPFFSALPQAHKLAEDMLKIVPGSDQSQWKRNLLRVLTQVRFPGLLVFVTDLMFPLEIFYEIMALCRAKNLEISTAAVFGEKDINPFNSKQGIIAVDSETEETLNLGITSETVKEYQYLFSQHLKVVEDYCKRNEIHFIA
ncbi:MAG: DUF58 domain-containing protein, partial [Candidatus Dadabacteria bacterium]